ncbi:MAG TPA: glycosyltransferase family 9 protein [Chthoniobacterales bacterium]
MRYLVFKPDGIGDFVLASGGYRLLADLAGEENLTLVVMPPVKSIARSQFPKATVIALPMEKKRKVVNVFVMNFLRCLGPWREIRRHPMEAAISFRTMRAYLHTFLFYSTRTKHFFGCENLLIRNRRWSRRFVEWVTRTFLAPRIAPYPEAAEGVPSELEAHRRVLSLALNREVALAEILPRLRTETATVDGNYWLCSPLSAIPSKNYPLESWCEVFRQVRDLIGGSEIRLTGSADQKSLLDELAGRLRAEQFSAIVELRPTLQGFVELINEAKWVLTIDTAAAHMACALDKRCLILFSGLLRGMFGPWTRSPRQVWLDPLPPPDGIKRKWFRGMPPDRVSAAIRALNEIGGVTPSARRNPATSGNAGFP